MSGVPARGYSWPPFTGADGDNPGWLASLRHGAHSQRVIDPLAEELAARLVEEAPELGAFRFRFCLGAWARAEARAAVLGLFLDATGLVDSAGEPRERLLRELRAEERRAAEERRELGLSPGSYARLQKELSEAARARVDVEKLVAEGRKIVEARRARGEIE